MKAGSSQKFFVQLLPAGDCPQKRWGCAAGGNANRGPCIGTPTHAIGYWYQTGRRRDGQLTRRISPVCLEHAQTFAARHGLTLPKEKRA